MAWEELTRWQWTSLLLCTQDQHRKYGVWMPEQGRSSGVDRGYFSPPIYLQPSPPKVNSSGLSLRVQISKTDRSPYESSHSVCKFRNQRSRFFGCCSLFVSGVPSLGIVLQPSFSWRSLEGSQQLNGEMWVTGLYITLFERRRVSSNEKKMWKLQCRWIHRNLKYTKRGCRPIKSPSHEWVTFEPLSFSWLTVFCLAEWTCLAESDSYVRTSLCVQLMID